MTGYELATLAISAVQAAASLGAVTAILVGLRRMDQANRARFAEAEAREKREDARHTETMRTADARHTEAMRTADTRHAEAMRALEALINGMETAIERTGGRV